MRTGRVGFRRISDMRRFVLILAVLGAGFLGACIGYAFRGWSDHDACLDHGGRWSAEFGYCEKLGPTE